jgi:hypothetical protein
MLGVSLHNEETRTIGATAMDGGNSERGVHHGRMVLQLRLEEDKVVACRHNYYRDNRDHDNEGFRRDRLSFRHQEAYYEWFEHHPRRVYLSSGHFANKTTEARVTIDVAGL